jgi:ribokinase
MTARKPSVLVLGSLDVDTVARTARLPTPGMTVAAHELLRPPGGKGANQAVAAAAVAEASVLLAGLFGDDEQMLAAAEWTGTSQR